MSLEVLREQVVEANLELVRKGLVLSTFGNASGIDRELGLIVIKPSGLPYEQLKPERLVVTDLHGKVVQGLLRPSSDLPTHAALYRSFAEIGGVAHTHSEYATAWAQAREPIPCLGTTHADYFHGPVPVTTPMHDEEIATEYELNTGAAIVKTFEGLDPMTVPGVLVANHGPFAWGASAVQAAENAWMLEVIARMAYLTLHINPDAGALGKALHDRHYLRKHGKDAYYGQAREKA
jgi:L-ribulose-5-phosphate 4-epimerase